MSRGRIEEKPFEDMKPFKDKPFPESLFKGMHLQGPAAIATSACSVSRSPSRPERTPPFRVSWRHRDSRRASGIGPQRTRVWPAHAQNPGLDADSQRDECATFPSWRRQDSGHPPRSKDNSPNKYFLIIVFILINISLLCGNYLQLNADK